MRIFFDTNVIIDLLANRPGFADNAEKAIEFADRTGNVGLISALTVCDIVYILRKTLTLREIGQRITLLRRFVEVIDVTGKTAIEAFESAGSDYEDTVQYLSAVAAKADVIVTRDKTGFVGAKVAVYTPQEFIQQAK